MPSPALSARWIRQRQPHWIRLEALLTACGTQGVRALSHREVRELALLYRQTAADLSTARGQASSADLARYLNELLGRAHHHVYTGPTGHARAARQFLTRGFPRAVRETWRETAIATALFAAGAVVAALLLLADPGFTRFLLGGEMLDTIERKEMWTHSIVAVKPFASSRIMTNNLAVCFLAAASGIFAGIGTVLVMLFNGLMIGAVGLACFQGGLSLSLWSFVAPHGALELPAIFIAGGAGLVLARALLLPGPVSRRDAIATAGGQAIRLVLGVIPLLVIAGLIEGFISPIAIAPSLKFMLGGGLFVLLVAWLLSGRTRDARPPAGATAGATGDATAGFAP